MLLKLTEALKKHAISDLGVAADASDDVCEKAIGTALKSGKLTGAKFAELSEAAKPATLELIDQKIQEGIAKGLAKFSGKAYGTLGLELRPDEPISTKAVQVHGGAAADVRVKGAWEQFSTTKSEARYPSKMVNANGHEVSHPLAGQRAIHGSGQFAIPLDTPSELDKAISGSWFKFLLNRNSDPRVVPYKMRMTELDKELCRHAIETMKFSGAVLQQFDTDGSDDGTNAHWHGNRMMLPNHVKALLDDSTSGGIEITPIAFDDAVVLTPVLYGELYPYVNLIPVSRGRRIKGGASLNPTITWGTAEGTPITVLTTTGFITAFDTTIYPAVGAIEIGLDFLEDSPTQIGQIIVDNYGRKFQETLDLVIAIGDGTTQPLGIFNTSAANVVLTDNNIQGPPTVSDYESLMFGVAKQFRFEPGAKPVFLGSDQSYRNARGIQVSKTDERRVFGLTHQDYNIMSTRYAIQNSIPNSKIAFVMLNRYRMYRRLGVTVRMEDRGETLALKNEKLIVVRGRWGGQMELGAAVALTTQAQA